MFEQSIPIESTLTRNTGIVILVYVSLVGAGLIANAVMGVRLLARPVDWAKPAETIAHRPLNVRDTGMLVLMLLALQLLVLLLTRLFKNAPDMVWLAMSGLSFHIAGLAILARMLKARSVSWKEAFGFDAATAGDRIAHGVLFYVAMLPILFVSSLLYQAFLVLIGYPITLQPVMLFVTESTDWWVRLYLLVFAVVIAPLFEELFFRGLGLPLLARRLGIGPAIFLTSLAFSFLHFHIPSLVPLFVISVAFSLAYVYTGSLLVNIVMHATFNGINLALLFIVT